VKFVHASDLHLDSPLRGLERYEGAPVDRVRGATRRAFENLIDLCLAEEAAFLLLAGDIFDGDWKDYGTGLFFLAQLARLGKAGIATYLVRGNHDAASQVTRYLPLPAHLHELGSRHPETRILEAHGVAIHGQSFATRAVTADLAVDYPHPVRGLFNIGLLHTSVDGRVGHEPYAPCSRAGLIAKGYDYWALGHVHTREVLARDPWIVFPGNLQGRQAREAGPKGATLVTVKEGRVAAVEARALDVVRWMSCDVDATSVGGTTVDEALEAVRVALARIFAGCEGRLVAAPITLRAGALVHRALLADPGKWTQHLRAIALEEAGDGLWVERVRFELAMPDEEPPARWNPSSELTVTEGPAVDEDVIGQFVKALRALRADPDGAELGGLVEELSELRRKLPGEVSEGDDGLRLDDPATLRQLVDEAEALVLSRLGRGDAA